MLAHCYLVTYWFAVLLIISKSVSINIVAEGGTVCRYHLNLLKTNEFIWFARSNMTKFFYAEELSELAGLRETDFLVIPLRLA